MKALEDKILAEGNKFDVFDDVKYLTDNGVKVPRIVEFIHKVKEKTGKNLGKIDDVNDLIKEIYQNV